MATGTRYPLNIGTVNLPCPYTEHGDPCSCADHHHELPGEVNEVKITTDNRRELKLTDSYFRRHGVPGLDLVRAPVLFHRQEDGSPKMTGDNVYRSKEWARCYGGGYGRWQTTDRKPFQWSRVWFYGWRVGAQLAGMAAWAWFCVTFK